MKIRKPVTDGPSNSSLVFIDPNFTMVAIRQSVEWHMDHKFIVFIRRMDFADIYIVRDRLVVNYLRHLYKLVMRSNIDIIIYRQVVIMYFDVHGLLTDACYTEAQLAAIL